MPLHAGKALQAHLENGLGLALRKLEFFHQALLGLGRGFRPADQGDDLVEVVESLFETEQNMLTILGLLEFEEGPPHHHLAAVLDKEFKHPLQAQHLGATVHDREQDDAEAVLERGPLVELVSDHRRIGVALELDNDPHALAVRLVAKIGNALDLFLVHHLGYLLDDAGLGDLVGNLGDDQGGLFGPGVGLDQDAPPHLDDAPPFTVGLQNALAAVDEASRGEVGAGHVAHKLAKLDVGLVNSRHQGVGDFAEVMGRYLGGHAHGDAVTAVDEQVRQPGGKDLGLDGGAVEVWREIDGVLVDIGQHVHAYLGEARLGVTVGRGGVTVDGPEVALSVDQGIAHGPGLGQPHQGVVDGAVAVGVVFLENFADHAGAFRVFFIGEGCLP